jgi:hypothetical protein
MSKADQWYEGANTLPYEEDLVAQTLVALHPDGMQGTDVARILGLSPERVRQIEQGALRRIKSAIRLGRFPEHRKPDTRHFSTDEVAVILADKRAPREVAAAFGISVPRLWRIRTRAKKGAAP